LLTAELVDQHDVVAVRVGMFCALTTAPFRPELTRAVALL
jgi:hypothetical protein